ncbi:MAG: hypothetical protein DRH15_09350 [Deltaproteobacteria bacterium]|nr:MAG: hypothetical protein DRH15_09350 [Deltaproteobacteria bacterium]
MKCPICKEEIPGTECEECGRMNPEEARFCMYCGTLLHREGPDTEEPDDAFDIESRILCPDGTCTGIIVNGKCTECGRPYEPGEEE